MTNEEIEYVNDMKSIYTPWKDYSYERTSDMFDENYESGKEYTVIFYDYDEEVSR